MPPVYTSDLMRECTFSVEVEVRQSLRVRLGLWMMRLAGRVMGCRIEVKSR